MIYLFDTDLLIFMVRGLKAPARRARNYEQAAKLMERCRKAQVAGDSVGLSALTVSELEFGARKSGKYDDEIAAVRKVLTPFDVYGYDTVSCPEHYGRIRYELEAQGQAVGSMDMLIAAHALALKAALVTNNDAHFSRITGLRVTNWLKGTAGSG
ncbi:MAG: type II toxin-antitoxin system VapC family toxin [Thermoguttaceae bacterium]|jgi:tRNA(fMet)-specific endonuclease VapC